MAPATPPLDRFNRGCSSRIARASASRARSRVGNVSTTTRLVALVAVLVQSAVDVVGDSHVQQSPVGVEQPVQVRHQIGSICRYDSENDTTATPLE
jgi:hypothetical protein